MAQESGLAVNVRVGAAPLSVALRDALANEPDDDGDIKSRVLSAIVGLLFHFGAQLRPEVADLGFEARDFSSVRKASVAEREFGVLFAETKPLRRCRKTHTSE